MTDQEFQKTWNELKAEIQDVRTELHKTQQHGRSRSTLRWLLIRRSAEALIFGIFTSILINYLIGSMDKPMVLMAILVLFAFCLIGLIGNIMQINSLAQIDFSTPVAEFRKHIGKFKLYNLMTLKLVFLSVPFYMAYMILWLDLVSGVNLLEVADPSWVRWNLIFSSVLLMASIWFFRNLRYDSPIKWIRNLTMDNGGREISEVAEFMA